MRSLALNTKTVYIAKRKEVDGDILFSTPVPIEVSWSTVTDKWVLDQLGTYKTDTKKLIAYNEDYGLIENGDRVYFDKEVPEEDNDNAEGADYYVTQTHQSLNSFSVYIAKLV